MSEKKPKHRHILLGVGVALLLLGAGGAAGAGFLTQDVHRQHQEQLRQFQAQLQRITPQFLADQQRLVQFEWFRPSPGQADAMPLLLKLEQSQALKLSETFTQAEIYKQALEIDYRQLDFSWMQALLAYDHLLLTGHPENQQLLAQEPLTLPISMHWPPALDYAHWFRLRLMQGLANNELEPALKEARHLAYVMLNSENLLFIMLGLNMLSWEQEAHAHWQGQRDLTGWQPLDAELLQVARRTYRAAGAYSLLGMTPPDVMAQVLGDPAVQVGICSGLSEGSASLLSYAFFPERQAQATQIAQWAQVRSCHSTHLKKIWAKPQQASEAFFRQTEDSQQYKYLSKIPWVRQQVGYILENIAFPNYLSDYEKMAEGK